MSYEDDLEVASDTARSFCRLYISPFCPALYTVVLPAAAQKLVANLSYHSIPNFPEKPFAYLDLPTEEAQKLRRKFNSTILRGKKMRVEEARIDTKKKKRVEEAGGGEPHYIPASPQRPKKRKAEDGILQGIELPEERHVKRGWTQDAQDKRKDKRPSSAKSEKSQMLFRAKIPPNAISNVDSKEKKKQEKQTKTSPMTLELTEYAKTTKYPTFLRNSGAKREGIGPLSFVDGKGWIDRLGAVIEPVSTRQAKTVRYSINDMDNNSKSKSPMNGAAESILRPEARSINSDSDSDRNSEVSSASGSDTASSSASTSSSERSRNTSVQNDTSTIPAPEIFTLPSTANANSPELLHELPHEPPGVTQPKEIHPLEALYKKRKTDDSAPQSTEPRTAPIKTVFSFFETEENEGLNENDPNDVEFAVPQTPFTKRDLESRTMRSAAPTPDTAAPQGRFRAPWDAVEGTEDDDIGGQSTMGAPSSVKRNALQSGSQERPTTAFEQHFWKEQGGYNRSWKARRREAQKEQRYNANKRYSFT